MMVFFPPPPSSDIQPIQIIANGTYNAPSNLLGYNPVTVNVRNSYTQSDEGKVVVNGGLVNQTTITLTENGTYNTTDNDEVVVNVSGGSSTSILSGTNEPTLAQGSNGDIYLKYGIVTENLSTFSIYKESSMSISCVENLITFDYVSGGSIGGQAYKEIDLTDIDNITYTMISGHHSYNNYQTPRFAPQLVIENTINPATAFVANTLSPVDGSRITTDDTTLTLTIDVTNLTGNYWIVFCSYGCDSTVKNMYFGNANAIRNAYVKVSGAWQTLIGTDIDDVITR